MARFFISYRRGDSAGHTGRLNDSLAQRFGHEMLFRDIEDLAPGVDFAGELDRALTDSGALLVVIGRTWATASDDNGRRLFHDGDFVRHEVGAALARDDVVVIPVLVDGAEFPDADDLPPDLQALRGRNAIEISDGRWDYDVKRLGDALAKQLGIEEVAAAPAATRRKVPAGMLVAAVVGIVAVVATFLVLASNSSNTPGTTLAEARDDPGVATTRAVSTTVANDPIVEQSEEAGSTTTSGLIVVVGEKVDTDSDVPTFVVGALTWTTDTEPTERLDWTTASTYCEQLTFLGNPARLPTIEELESIVDAADPSAFDHKIMRTFHDGIGSNWIWSSDEDGAASAFAYDFTALKPVSLAVNFAEGAHAFCVSP